MISKAAKPAIADQKFITSQGSGFSQCPCLRISQPLGKSGCKRRFHWKPAVIPPQQARRQCELQFIDTVRSQQRRCQMGTTKHHHL